VWSRRDARLRGRVGRYPRPGLGSLVVGRLAVFRSALPGDASDRVATGLLWVAILFPALLALTRAFVPEREQRVLDALVLAPIDRSCLR